MKGIVVAALALEALGGGECGGHGAGHANSAYESHASSPSPSHGGGSNESHGGGSYEPHGGSAGPSEPTRSERGASSPRVATNETRESRDHVGSDLRAAAGTAGLAALDALAGGGVSGSDVPPSADDGTDPSPADDLDGENVEAQIRAMDLVECRRYGAPVGFGRVRVTVRADGLMTRLYIESPANLTPEAVDCIGGRLGQVVAPPFRGPPADVYATFYVR